MNANLIFLVIQETNVDAMKAFKLFDRDNDGIITIEELKNTLQWIDIHLEPSEYDQLLNFIDTDEDGG